MIEELTREIFLLRQEVKQLTLLILKNKVDDTWIPESMAAEMLGLKPRTLREAVKNKKGLFSEIDFRHTNGQRWQYHRKSLLKFKDLTSTAA